MMASLTLLVARMIHWCRDVSLGYSQTDRWNIRDGGNADCSSLVIWCLREAGFDTGDATYTGNMSRNLTARGWKRLAPTVIKQAGDILLNDACHVAVYIGGNQLAQASISENNTISGMGGDQTGRETNISTYYDYPWNAVLRYTGETEDDMPTASEIAKAVWEYHWKGDKENRNCYDKLRYLTEARTWDEKTHFSPLGNLIARFPVEYGTGKNKTKAALADRIAYIDAHTHVVDTRIEALTAAVEALSKSIGADPNTIGQAVETAVKAKLDALDIKVTAE